MEFFLGLVLVRSSSSKHWERNKNETWVEIRSTMNTLIWKFALWSVQFSSIQSLSHVWLFEAPWTESQWSHPTISFSDVHFPTVFNLSQHQGLFQQVSSSHQMVKVLELQLPHLSSQWIWLVWALCSPRDSQESSPTLQFKSISSLALSFLYIPTLTSIHDY